MAKRTNPLAPYYVQMRELERRLLTDALKHAATMAPNFEESIRLAASLLGVTPKYVRVRARILGGVLPGDPKNEPPKDSFDTWQHGGGQLKRKPPAVEEIKPDA